MKRMMIWLTAFLILANCAVPGDFCQVVPGPKVFAPETGRQIVKTDREDAEQIAVENEYGARNCKWKDA